MSIKKAIKKASEKRLPVWKGPESSDPNGGVTQSLLEKFLGCRERFRIRYILGLNKPDSFDHKIEFGNLWHACEEALAGGHDWVLALTFVAKGLSEKYPMARADILKWYEVIRVQFPVYITYWKKRDDKKECTPLLQEQVFSVPYALPSGRVVYLRGKWDGVEFLKAGKNVPKEEEGIYLKEHKTKGDIDEIAIPRRLTFDLQTMTYLVALESWNGLEDRRRKIRGVNYNVIRRPLSGGKGTIRQHKPTKSNPKGESSSDFYNRLAKDYIIPEPEYWFMRWKVEVSPAEIDKFKREFLNPILEQLCDWYSWVRLGGDPFSPNDGCENSRDRSVMSYTHYRMPFIFNPLAEGGGTHLDSFLDTGSEVGLVRSETLFEELK